jgi:eukaryotic-like serine/threonine-protein kinase
MSGDPLRLDALLESVADGSEVDWDAAEAAADENQRRIVRNLRLVASIAQVHRSIPDEVSAGPAPEPGLPTVGANEALQRWGHLLILETIGEGSFGDVYRARDPWLDRQVALKLLKPDIAAPARLMAEAQALARVRHPNVVTVHGADMRDGRVGLWMELVRGRTLAAIVASDGSFSAAEASVIGQELCRAVAAVHAVGLVHRDIKAQNVMRESGGRLVLMDFGAGHTPLYAAPELTNGAEATVATDIYALGVLLYFLVVGKYPVVGSSREELREAHTRGERRRLRDVRPDLPLAFIETVERALDPAPARRFATAGEMEQALARANREPSVQTPATQDRLELQAPPVRLRWAVVAAAVLVGVAAATWWYIRPAAPPRPDTQLIAVLPLLGPAADQEYFADGMTDALMQELATLRSVRVVSRTSVDLARMSAKTLPAIAAALNANAILEGSVSTSGDHVRVNLRLIHAGSDTPVWARSFEQPLNHVFGLQRDIARAVAAELAVANGALANRQPDPVDPVANDQYLRGRYFLHQETVDGMKQAVGFFEAATRRDPKHGRSYAGIAQAYLALGAWYNAMPRADAFRLSREAVERALAIDRELPEAHAVLAEILFEHDWNWSAAEREFTQALQLNPSLEYARERYAMFLAARGRTDAALVQIADARRVDPLSPVIAASAAGILRYARRYEEAVQEFNRVLATHPDLLSANVGLARTLNALGRHDEAIAIYRRLAARGFNQAVFTLEIAQADAAAGRVDQARRAVETLRKQTQASGATVPPEYLAFAYGRIGDHDEAFRWLDEAFRTKSGLVLWLPVDYRSDPLRSDARFSRYLEQLNVSR